MGLFERAAELMETGGWAMWPLLLLSVVSLTLSAERAMFWMLTHGRAGRRRLAHVLAIVREKGPEGRGAALVGERGIYAAFARDLVATLGGTKREEMFVTAVAHELIERYRPTIERFSNTMSTIITASPMIGILGTVTGIIESFRILGAEGPVTDPAAVAGGIAEALLTTAFGLVVALVTLFPYAWARTQGERCLSRLEAVAASTAAG